MGWYYPGVGGGGGGTPTDSVRLYDTLTDLRAETDYDGNSFGAVGENEFVYGFDPTETTADDGDNYIKPDDIGGGSPGRWVKSAVLTYGDMYKADYDDGADDGTVAKAAALKPGGTTLPSLLDFKAYETVPGSVFKSRDLCVQNQYAYLCSHSFPGTPCVACFDISDPRNPVYVSGIALTLDGNNATLCNAIYVRGDYAYVGRNGGRLVVVDFSDVANPVQRGTVTHGGQVFGLDAAGGFVYIANSSSGFYIVDVSDKDNPITVGSATGFGAGGVSAYGRYAFVTAYGTDELRIYDCIDVTNPTLVGSAATGSFPVVFHVESGYAYVVQYGGTRVEIFDVSDVTSPSLKSSFNTQYNTGSYGKPKVVGDFLYISCGDGVSQSTLEMWNAFDKSNPTLFLTKTGFGSVTNIAHPFVDGSAIFLPAYIATNVSGGIATVCNFVWSFLNLRLGDITVGRVNAIDRSVFRDLDIRGDMNVGNNLSVGNNIIGADVKTGGTIFGTRTTAFADSPYNASRNDRTIRCNCTGGVIVVNLPTAATSIGRQYVVKKVDASSNAVTLTPYGAETIEGEATLSLDAQYGIATIQSNGTSWDVLDIQSDVDALYADATSKSINLQEPDVIQAFQDAVPVLAVESEEFPHGIDILKVYVKTWGGPSGESLSVNIEKWDSPTDGSPSTIVGVTVTDGNNEANGTPADAAAAYVATGSILMVDLDSADVDSLLVHVIYRKRGTVYT